MRKTPWVAALATVALLAACSSGGGDTDETTPSAQETTGAPSSDVTLTVWVDANRKPAVAAAAEAFESETGVKVELVEKNFEDIRTDFLAQVPTGEGPDITVGAHDWLGALIVNGVVDSIDLGDTASNFEPVSVQAFTYDGQLYGLPYAFECVALVRNTDLDPDPAPATFEELIAKGRTLGTKLPFVINTNGTTGDGYTYYPLQTSFGAPVFVQAEDGSYTNEIGMGGPEGFAFADWLGSHGMAGDGLFSTDWTYDIANQEFADGNAPYTIAGPWAISTFTDAGINVAVDPVPSAGGKPAQPFVGVQGFYISSQSKNALVAQDFLVNYIATPEAMMALYEADPRIPAYTSVAEEVASDPVTAGFLAASKTGVPMPSIPEMGSVWDHWNAAQSSIIQGTAAPADAWNKMLTDLQATLAG